MNQQVASWRKLLSETYSKITKSYKPSHCMDKKTEAKSVKVG